MCDHLLADCDRAAAHLLGDTTAAVRAETLRSRTAATRYGMVRRQCRALAKADAVLAGHRDRFEQRRRRLTVPAQAAMAGYDTVG
ncbi:hypothetical protein [Rhodococcus zopfii]|uniref:hypothetical protein n=1 Tax=Rhodococcus zopfii TaxID=43772 RepID=UPI001F0F95DF|nr:hypothetical protein [Rhodococcus zopfii]